MTLIERFLDYVKIPTGSDPASETVPSSPKEWALAHRLVEDMKAIGIADAFCDALGYVYGHIPATPGMESRKKIGFIAHMDTAPDFADSPVCPQILENYDGEDVVLSDSGRVLSRAVFPHLPDLKGKTLITTDGHTLLGADDKAGVAEILYAVEKLLTENRPHGQISIAFTPDEEVGRSIDNFDLKVFDAELAYTADGGDASGVSYECFNACTANLHINGFNIHPGSAKGTMINASLVAMEVNAMLPSGEIPSLTEGYEGFFHLCSMRGDVESANLEYILRDHSAERFEGRKQTLLHIVRVLNEKYGENTVTLTITDSYRNMLEMIRPAFEVVEKAEAAIRAAGLEPHSDPIRGGTDGAWLSYMGLPTPNIGTGGFAGHGPYEHATAEGMEKCAEIIGNIIDAFAE